MRFMRLKRLETSLLVILAILVGSGCASVQKMDGSRLKTYSLTEVKSDKDAQDELTRNMENGKSVVIFITKGERLPLMMSADVGVVRVEPPASEIEFTRDVYIHIGSKMMWIGPDNLHWAKISDPDGIKRVFGLSGGRLSLGYGLSRELGPHLVLGLKAR